MRLLEWYERRGDVERLRRHWDALLDAPRADPQALARVRRQARRWGDGERAQRAADRLAALRGTRRDTSATGNSPGRAPL